MISPSHLRRVLLPGLVVWVSACAAPLGLGRPATVIEPGRFRVGADGGMRVAPDAVDAHERAVLAVRAGQRACEGEGGVGGCLTREDWAALVEGAAYGPLSSPETGDGALSVRYGVAPGWDAGVRLGSSSLRVEGARQWVGDPLNGVDSGVTLLTGLGLSQSFAGAAHRMELLELKDAGRSEADLFVLAGYRHDRAAYLTVGARYIAAHLSGRLIPLVPVTFEDGAPGDLSLPDTDVAGFAHHLGLVASAYAGVGAAYLGMEVVGGLDLTSVRVLGADVLLSGLSVRPALVFFLEI